MVVPDTSKSPAIVTLAPVTVIADLSDDVYVFKPAISASLEAMSEAIEELTDVNEPEI